MGGVRWASGRWQVKEGQEGEFVERWKNWLGWTSETIPGFRTATLLRSEDDPLRFTSVSDWNDDASLRAWSAHPAFAEKFGPVKELCDEFLGGNFDVAASFSAPSA